MKKYWLLYLLFFYSFTQIMPQSVILDPDYPYTAVKYVDSDGKTQYTYYSSWPTKIGREDDLNGPIVYRTEYQFNISDIPENSEISRVYIRYTNTTYLISTASFNISHTSGTNINKALYDEIYTSGEIVSDLNYTTSSLDIESEAMKNLIVQLLADGKDKMFLGTFSNDENSNLSATGFINDGFQLVVEYYKPVKIWVTNNFNILGNANEGQILLMILSTQKQHLFTIQLVPVITCI